MMDNIKYLASAEPAANNDIVSALGIDWMMLIFQLVAFLVLVWALGKYVYPWLMKSVDDRKAQIDSGAKAAIEAQAKAIEAEERIEKLIKKARNEASDIITTAKTESASILALAEEKSKKRADQIAAEAKAQIDKDILNAKRELHNETIELVAMAVEKIAGKVVSDKIDNNLIINTLKDKK